MKNFYSLLVSVFLCSLTMAQSPSGEFKKTLIAPVIDGVADAVWADAQAYNIATPFLTEVASVGTLGQTTWQALWDNEGIYILLKVADDAFLPAYMNAATDSWNYDKPEIYFDVNVTLVDGMGASGGYGHYQVAPGFSESNINGSLNTENSGVKYSFLVSGQSYIAEYFVPFSMLLDEDGTVVNKSGTIGFDVTIIDRDAADGSPQRVDWANDGTIDASWNNMDGCGKITLAAAGDAVLASSISISSEGSANTITSEAGTLQMNAEILPANASILTAKWTVTNGTGKATITSDGKLTAKTNGTVTVTASTKDETALSSSMEITISNQFVTMDDLSIIVNGDFNSEGAVGSPWNGNAVVVNGVAVCDPPAGGANTWDWALTQVINAIPDIPYIFTFVTHADAVRTFNVDFEDSNHSYNRYGVSIDPESNGTSDWTFDVTTEPVKKVFHVIFTIVENTHQSMQFMLGNADEVVYLDSVYLVAEDDLGLLSAIEVGVHNNIAKTLKIYPNPVVNEISVSTTSKNEEVAVFNALGQQIMSKVSDGNQVKFDVSGLKKGMYIVKLSNGTIGKFLKL